MVIAENSIAKHILGHVSIDYYTREKMLFLRTVMVIAENSIAKHILRLRACGCQN